MNTPARTSVTPRRSRAKCAVGVEATQEFGRFHRRGPLLFRGFGYSLAVAAVVGLAGMGQHAAKLQATGTQESGDRRQLRIARHQAAAMSVAIDFDQDSGHVPGWRRIHQRLCLLDGIDEYRDADTALHQRLDPGNLVRRQAHRIGHVGESRLRKILRFPDRRDGDRATPGREQPFGHVD
jgi:hypothetical protein